jgi:hypothetical protein
MSFSKEIIRIILDLQEKKLCSCKVDLQVVLNACFLITKYIYIYMYTHTHTQKQNFTCGLYAHTMLHGTVFHYLYLGGF